MNIITFRTNYAEYKNNWELKEEQNPKYKTRNNVVIPRKTEKQNKNQFEFVTDFLKSMYSFASEKEPGEKDIIIQNYGGLAIGASIYELKNMRTEDASKTLEIEVIKNINRQDANLKPKKTYASTIVGSNVKDLRISIYQLYDAEEMEPIAYAIKRKGIKTGIKKLDSFLRGACIKTYLQSPVFYANITNNGSMNIFNDVIKGDSLDNYEPFRSLGLKVYQTNQFELKK